MQPISLKLRHKAGSFALLIADAREGYRRFPHSEVSHHFLALALIRLISSGASIRFLRRGIVTNDLLEIFAELFCSATTELAGQFIRRLESAMTQEATFDRLPDNSASLLITSLCRNDQERSSLLQRSPGGRTPYFSDPSPQVVWNAFAYNAWMRKKLPLNACSFTIARW